MTTDAMDTINTDIREEIPEGYVSTENVIAAVKGAGEKYKWCGTERYYLEQHTYIRFGKQVWDQELQGYVPQEFDPWAVTEEAPTVISKADMVRTLKAAIQGHPYEARRAVNEIAEKLGLDFKLFNDSFEITIKIDANSLFDENGDLNLDDEYIEDTDYFARALRAVVHNMLYDRNGYVSLGNNEHVESGALRFKRIPDPARQQQHRTE